MNQKCILITVAIIKNTLSVKKLIVDYRMSKIAAPQIITEQLWSALNKTVETVISGTITRYN